MCVVLLTAVRLSVMLMHVLIAHSKCCLISVSHSHAKLTYHPLQSTVYLSCPLVSGEHLAFQTWLANSVFTGFHGEHIIVTTTWNKCYVYSRPEWRHLATVNHIVTLFWSGTKATSHCAGYCCSQCQWILAEHISLNRTSQRLQPYLHVWTECDRRLVICPSV